MKRTTVLIGVLLVATALALGACTTGETPSPVVIKETVEVPVEVPVEGEAMVVVPFEAEWAESGHNDAEAEAFVHWDEDDPAVIPDRCARCHSTPGSLDWVGADGSEAGVMDQESHAIGTTITCEACHNDATAAMDSVVMPSGIELTDLGGEARCMQCPPAG